MSVPRRRLAFASHVPALAELEAHGGAAAPKKGTRQVLKSNPAGLP
jgi:hypothetical protein